MMMLNKIGIATLYKREVWRFLKVWNQTLIAPVVTNLLFLAVLSLAMGGAERKGVGNLSYEQFIMPGLIMMAVVQNAFANSSSSLMLQKIQGVIVDLLMPPLSGGEVTFSLVMGGVTRGVMVGIVVYVSLIFFVSPQMHHPLLALFYMVAASVMLALIGILTGIWSQSFDQLAAITNYIVTPLSFLSGTFYSTQYLPTFWQHVSHFNPFFYMIDGFRFALTDYSDGNTDIGMVVLMVMDAGLWVLVRKLLNLGWRLKT